MAQKFQFALREPTVMEYRAEMANLLRLQIDLGKAQVALKVSPRLAALLADDLEYAVKHRALP